MNVNASDVPEPIAFTLDAAETARILARFERAAGRQFTYPFAAFMVSLETATWLLRVRHYGWNDPISWFYPAAIASFIIFVIALAVYRRRHVPVAMRPDVPTRVTFADRSFDVSRDDGRPSKTVSVMSVRAVSATPEAFLVRTSWASPMLVIPKRAFADGGDALLAYFERRLVAQRMLRRSLPRTNIVNTMAR